MSRRDEPGTVYLIHFDRPVADQYYPNPQLARRFDQLNRKRQ